MSSSSDAPHGVSSVSPSCVAATPLTMIELYKKGSPDYDQWVEWGNDILTTGLFAIIICATLGMLAIFISVPHLLQKVGIHMYMPCLEGFSWTRAGGMRFIAVWGPASHSSVRHVGTACVLRLRWRWDDPPMPHCTPCDPVLDRRRKEQTAFRLLRRMVMEPCRRQGRKTPRRCPAPAARHIATIRDHHAR